MTCSCGVLLALACGVAAAEENSTYLIGRSSQDITLPVYGVQLMGFVHPDQIGEGLHQRIYARTFVIGDVSGKNRVAIVTCDLAFPTHTLRLAVLERLRKKFGDRYGYANVVLACTHTHAAPGGYHHSIDSGVFGGGFYNQCFDAAVDGISESIIEADNDLKPGQILFGQGDVADAGVNRSRVAYMNNPAEERAKYKNDVDNTMTLLNFVRDGASIGTLNWFAVHGTSMNLTNKLVSGDNKGYAAYAVEKAHGARHAGKPEFVAAFAQSNCGDVTPNLTLKAKGPGKDDVESTRIIGQRQAREAEKLLTEAREALHGPVEYRHEFVDFSQLPVAAEFTGAGPQQTSPSALGYSFAAGSTEDGGGSPMFKEGMKETNPLIEGMVRSRFPGLLATPELRQRHKPKAILLATGLPKPPMQEQVLPLGVVKIGQLALAVGPAEFTTMAGRRMRTAVGKELEVDPRYVVIAGYANDYANYVTTREEYESQQYEGGSTLFGPWTEAGYRQEYAGLAHAIKTGQPVTSKAQPVDMRTRVQSKLTLEGPDDQPPAAAKPGDVVTDAKDRYAPGEQVAVTFWTGSPINDYRRTDRFMAVERRDPGKDTWHAVCEDFDWDKTVRWKQMVPEATAKPAPDPNRIGPAPRVARPEPFQVTISWQTNDKTAPGTYRIASFGRFKKDGKVERLVSYSKPFEVKP
jgi:neutral ceramidase